MKHIILVDDDLLQLTMFRAMLAPGNYQISTYSDALKALSDLPKIAPDLILLDLALPKMNGFELYAHIREEKAIAHVPVVAISAQVSSNTIIRCRELGFLDVLAKPIDLYELRRKVADYLETT